MSTTREAEEQLMVEGDAWPEPSVVAPEIGNLVVRAVDDDVDLGEVEYWFQGDGYVVRSREFSYVAQGETLDIAFQRFVEASLNHALALSRLVLRGQATDTETEMRRMLLDRLFPLLVDERKSSRQRRSFVDRVLHRASSALPTTARVTTTPEGP